MTKEYYNQMLLDFEWLRYKEAFTKEERWSLGNMHHKYLNSKTRCASCQDLHKLKFDVLGFMNQIKHKVQAGEIILEEEKLTEPNPNPKDPNTSLMDVINQKLIELEQNSEPVDEKSDTKNEENSEPVDEKSDTLEVEVDADVKSMTVETIGGDVYSTDLSTIEPRDVHQEVKIKIQKPKNKNK